MTTQSPKPEQCPACLSDKPAKRMTRVTSIRELERNLVDDAIRMVEHSQKCGGEQLTEARSQLQAERERVSAP